VRPNATNATTDASDILAISFNKDGTLSKSAQDAVEASTFSTLIEYVRQQIEQLADRIVAGDVSVTPYRVGDETPCARCDYARVCRIDRVINTYRVLPPLTPATAVEFMNQSNTLDTESPPHDH